MKKDHRINAKSMTFSNYLIIFLATLFFCGSYAGIYFLQISSGELYAVLSMFTYIVVISASVCVLFGFFRRRVIMRPIDRLCEAAQKVARGDFSVRLEPMRKDGKKDEFEVLFEDFNTMVSELGSTEMLKNDFVANVSHELKTPLAVMQNYGTLLQQPGLTEAQRMEYGKAITDASRRLAALVTNILKLNKLENQQISPQFEEYDLSEQVCQCLLGFEEAWENKGLEIETDIEDGITVKSDEEMMSLVWNNLFSNAVKFTDPGGTVSLSLRGEGEYAVVKVRDTGCGISPEVGQHIFDKFYQGDTSHATQGNGLGLALVKRVIDLTGGDISVESELGKGTAFTVRLKRDGP